MRTPVERSSRVRFDETFLRMNAARVVLIDDQAMVRQLLGQHLTGALGHDLVASCRTVEEGFDAIGAGDPDLAIVDWTLPDGSGLELVRKSAAARPRMGWLLLAEDNHAHVVREAVAIGVQGFVMKQSDLAFFGKGVGEVLAGRRYYCPVSSRLLVESSVESMPEAPDLTSRELDVLRGFARGGSPRTIAGQLNVSVKTVQNHLSNLKDKLRLRAPGQLVRYAIKKGLVEGL